MILPLHSWVYIQEKWKCWCSHKDQYTNVCSSIIHNHSKLETTENFFIRWIKKETGLWPYDGILHSNKKEQIVNTCNSLCESQNTMLNEGSQSQNVTYCIIPFTWYFWKDNIIVMKNKSVIAWGWDGRNVWLQRDSRREFLEAMELVYILYSGQSIHGLKYIELHTKRKK